ncbi:MAG: hypothetical protein VW405_01025 [Rhodospirillaceae bacterium]
MPQDSVAMRSPNGSVRDVPRDRVDEFLAKGATLVESAAPVQPTQDGAPGRSVLGDVLGGLRSSAARTLFGGGDLVRAGWNTLVPDAWEYERIYNEPDVQAMMRAPESGYGTLGRIAGDIAQFAVPMSKVSSATRGMGTLARMATEGAAGAGVAAVPSAGDPASMLGGAIGGSALPAGGAAMRGVRNAFVRGAYGAEEGGVGGAIAGVARAITPGQPRTMLVQALKPRNTNTRFTPDLDVAMPEIKAAEQSLGGAISGIDDMLNATRMAKQRLWDRLVAIRGQAGTPTIDGNAIADAMERSIPRYLRIENESGVNAIQNMASGYRRQMSLPDADELLREANARLDSYYAQFPQQRAVRNITDPQIAAVDAQARALRTAIDDALNRMADGAGDAAREIRRRYGSLMNVEQVALSRSNVAARQQPMSLSEQIGNVSAAGDLARATRRALQGDVGGALMDAGAGLAKRSTAKAIKESQTTDALIRRAFAEYSGAPEAIPEVALRPIRGLLPRGPIVTPAPQGGSGVWSVPAASHVQRNARTGRFQRVYTGEGQ